MKFHKIFLDVLRKCLGFLGGSGFFPISTSFFFVTIPSSVPGNLKHTICQFTWQVRKQPCLQTFKGHDYTTQPKHFTRTNNSKKLLAFPFFDPTKTCISIYIYRNIYRSPWNSIDNRNPSDVKMVKVLATDFASQLSHGKKKSFPKVFPLLRCSGPEVRIRNHIFRYEALNLQMWWFPRHGGKGRIHHLLS